ncbi:Protein of unknown function [Faunimonas pinastri]|uniref:DUF3168 domain-containing protein n=1 Tax=Faunimonas pinastri TaxID=1855383 RepID=A0A1H9F506_9HYPH|nr:DUF3168 domain-containing protein [Faunimonas pinastri]SEQ33064.1 Protein of unknown function [Faunimonas pinastri]
MSDPALAVQKAVYEQLTASASLVALISGRVYDSVPEQKSFPYVVIGEDQVNDDGDGCSDGSEIFVDVHVWSRRPGKVEAKSIGGAVRAALGGPIPMEGFATIVGQFYRSHYLTDPGDGLTAHGVLTFRYLVEPL